VERLQKTTETIIRFDWSLGIQWNLAPSENKEGGTRLIMFGLNGTWQKSYIKIQRLNDFVSLRKLFIAGG